MTRLVGQHMMVDGHLSQPLNTELLTDILTKLTRLVGLTPLGDSLTHESDHGWAGLQMIAESHISLHSWDDNFWLDVFSCRAFDPEVVLGYVREWGRPRHTTILNRSAGP